jgi:hypothetical protein
MFPTDYFESNANMPGGGLSELRLRESPFWVSESNVISFYFSQFLISQEVSREKPAGYTECDGLFFIVGARKFLNFPNQFPDFHKF